MDWSILLRTWNPSRCLDRIPVGDPTVDAGAVGGVEPEGTSSRF